MRAAGFNKRLSIIFLTGFFLILSTLSVIGQSNNSDQYLFFPREYNSFQSGYSLGISMTILPRAIVEEEIRQIPMLDFNYRLGLPLNFSINARASTIYITNLATAGLKWSYSLGWFSLAAGYDMSYWYGFADIEGFDVTSYGFINTPNVNFGIDFDDFLFTLRIEGIIISYQKTLAGEVSIASKKDEFVGTAFSFFLEQPLWKDNHVILALKLNYSKSMYQSWMAFSTFNERLVYPEFIFGFIF